MFKLLLLLLVIFTTLLPGKETKKITARAYNPDLKETSYVLKSDPSVRHGSYFLESNGKILIEGHYNMGKKDSIWTQYTLAGKIRFRGRIMEDKRVGIWEYYNYPGELEQKIDFSKNEVLYYQTAFAGYPFLIFSGNDTIVSVLDRPPLYIGGTSKLNELLVEETRIPLHKSGETYKGTIYVRFNIDSTGRTSGHHVLKGTGRILKDAAVRVMKRIPDDWMPGIFNGKPVSVQYIVPIIFDENTRLAEYP